MQVLQMCRIGINNYATKIMELEGSLMLREIVAKPLYMLYVIYKTNVKYTIFNVFNLILKI